MADENFTRECGEEAIECLKEILEKVPDRIQIKFSGHVVEIMAFLEAATKEAAPEIQPTTVAMKAPDEKQTYDDDQSPPRLQTDFQDSIVTCSISFADE